MAVGHPTKSKYFITYEKICFRWVSAANRRGQPVSRRTPGSQWDRWTLCCTSWTLRCRVSAGTSKWSKAQTDCRPNRWRIRKDRRRTGLLSIRSSTAWNRSHRNRSANSCQPSSGVRSRERPNRWPSARRTGISWTLMECKSPSLKWIDAQLLIRPEYSSFDRCVETIFKCS